MKQVDVVAGVIFNAERTEVLLALRKPEQHQGDRWEFPGGKIEGAESPEAALARELYEEISIQVEECSPRLTLEHQYPDKHVRLNFRDVTRFSGEPHGQEGQQLRWVKLQELPQLSFPEANQPVVEALSASVR